MSVPKHPGPPRPPADDDGPIPLADEAPGPATDPAPGPEPEGDSGDELEYGPARSNHTAPIAPLPRMWKAEPEPEPQPARKARPGPDAPESKPAAKAKAGAAPARAGKGDEGEAEGKAKGLEETPAFDTVETRQRVRVLVGVVGCLAVAVTAWSIWNALPGRQESDADLPDEARLAAAPTDAAAGAKVIEDKAKGEAEAKALMAQARRMGAAGKAVMAVAMLNRIIKTYPGTAPAREAKEALDRPRSNLPLFLDGPAVVADATAAPKAAAPPVVTAEAARPDLPNPTAGRAELVLPPNPAEAPSNAATTLPRSGVAARALPAGFRARPEAGVHPSGWPVAIVGDRDGATMVLIPGGTFPMGRDDVSTVEGPSHPVTLGAYYLDQHEVTIRQYALFHKETGRKDGSGRPPAPKDGPAASASEEQPATMVNARDARAYAAWAGKALPTEAQWEMAARTPDGRVFPWGSDAPQWPRPREPRQVDPVMSFATDLSPYGVYDLAGNAMEWTSDLYDIGYHSRFRGAAAVDPTGPATSRTRPPQATVKGGSRSWQVSWREGQKLDTRLPYLGFRCALPVDAPATRPAGAEAAQPPARNGAPAGGSVAF